MATSASSLPPGGPATGMFVPNGLLGAAKPLALDRSSATHADSEFFIDPPPTSSGCVSDGLQAKSRNEGRLQPAASTHSENDAGAVKSFIPNGSLSNPQFFTMLPPTLKDALNHLETINYDLPPVFEAFGVPTSLLGTSVASSGPSSLSVPISRFSIRATTFDGKAVNLKRKPKVSQEARKRISSTISAQKMGNLLDIPIHRLMDELSADAATKMTDVGRPVPVTSQVEDTLWVDRYRPHRFAELIGNERVARETMAWVKQWDWCVFGKKKGKKRPREGDANNNENDEYHRPQEKLLLLSGPPGLGKTTLAHVVARHAGYEVMEINASDARSGSIIDDRIRPALESGSAVGSTKPILLIIDEIDGATGGGDGSNTFIHKLVQLIYDKPRGKQRSGKTRAPNAKRPILRPIICICNDQHASSLAKLKLHAHHVRFQRPGDIHTVKRLREVCDMEGLRADSRALTTLVGLAKGDLRGCLNALQFVQSRAEEVTEDVIRRATMGMKEADTSLTSVLNDLFNPLSKKRVKELAMGEEAEARYVARLVQVIDESGKESSIALGCFGHYATLRQHDANFSRYERANEWLLTFDVFSAAMYNNGDFALDSYLPYTLVAFYPLFQERGGSRVERNQGDWENLQLTRANEEILKTLSRCLRSFSTCSSGNFRQLLNSPVLQLEFVPLINRIISPPLRPVNSQVIRPEEKSTLTRLVNLMVSLELRFIQERSEDGQLSYRLDPPIDVFVTYDGKRAADIAISRYAVRHLVAGEIDARLIARDADIIEKGKPGRRDYFTKSNISKQSRDPHNLDGPPNKRSRVDEIDIADKPPTDFFGRVISVPSTDKQAAAINVEKRYRVTYRFKEGNSSAVRRPLKFGAFL